MQQKALDVLSITGDVKLEGTKIKQYWPYQ